jgi:hypothetical protein
MAMGTSLGLFRQLREGLKGAHSIFLENVLTMMDHRLGMIKIHTTNALIGRSKRPVEGAAVGEIAWPRRMDEILGQQVIRFLINRGGFKERRPLHPQRFPNLTQMIL